MRWLLLGIALFFAIGTFTNPRAKQLPRKAKEQSHMTVADALDIVRPSIVQLLFRADMNHVALGTGFFVNADGCIVTARHVLLEGQRLLEQVQATRKQILVGIPLQNFEDEQGGTVRGNFITVGYDPVGEDPRHDLVVLKLKQNPFKGEVRSGFVLKGGELPVSVAVARLDAGRPKEGAEIAI